MRAYLRLVHSTARIGLVLGAGGPVGHAFHTGVLRALTDAVGWDARHAERIIGTSAGAQVGALLRAGMSAHDLAARASGEAMTPRGAAIARHYVRPARREPDPTRPRRLMPSSPAYLLRGARQPWRLRPGRLVSALLPEGRVSLDSQVSRMRPLFGHRWPERELYITAVHLDTGRAVAFGAPDAPPADVATAVACSGAVPSVCAPIVVGGRRYVDGGIASATHLDRVSSHLHAPHDLVIVSSPLSMFRPMRGLLRAEMRRLRDAGTPVVAFEPAGESLDAMGLNPMDMGRSARVVDAAYRTALRQIEHPAKRRLRDFF